MPCWPEPVEVKPGQTVQVRIGGKGRPVIGRVVLDGTPESPVDWTQNEPADSSQARNAGSPRRSIRTAGSVSRMSRRASTV